MTLGIGSRGKRLRAESVSLDDVHNLAQWLYNTLAEDVRTGAASVACNANVTMTPARRFSAQVLRSVGGRSHRRDIPWVLGVRADALGNLNCPCGPSKDDPLRRK